MTRSRLFRAALELATRLRSRVPGGAAVQSAIGQLEYLIELDQGARTDRERLSDIIIGVLAVREIEPLDHELADVLYQVVEEVQSMER